MRPSHATLQVAVTVAVMGCRATTREATGNVQPVAPTSVDQPRASAARADTTRRGYTAADVRFMQGMIAHHGQALVMTDLLKTRTNRPDMRLLAERIDVSQKDEILSMQRWLASRGEEVPSAAAQHHMAAGHMPLMPGMLTDEELAQLEKSTGAEFDRLFLLYMIRHHEGALKMVADLFATNGAVQEPQLFAFASDVDADQRAEIARMRSLSGADPDPTTPSKPQ